MHLIMPRFAWLQMLLLCCVLLATACSAGANRSETADLQITLMTPTADTLVVQLLDNADQPITDAKVAVEGNMNHAGMAPVFADAVTDDADGTTDGRYQLPFTFSMLGDWILTVTIEQTDGTTITRDLEVTAASDGISGDAIGTMDHSTMDHSTMDHSTMDHSSMAAMVADNIMARAVPMADANGAVYLMLTNGTATDDQLVAVESNIAKAAELHETINDNNVMRM
ncbi:MAG: FixH family protein, partial [Caldilineaceae bacterium]